MRQILEHQIEEWREDETALNTEWRSTKRFMASTPPR